MENRKTGEGIKSDGTSYKVLVVDDSPVLRKILKKIFADEHYEVCGEAADGEAVLDMYKEVCRSIAEYKILNQILNTKILPNFGGGRRRKCMRAIAAIAGTKMNHVDRVAKRVRPWLDKYDFLNILINHQVSTPMADEIFSKEELDKYFEENEGETLNSLLCGLYEDSEGEDDEDQNDNCVMSNN